MNLLLGFGPGILLIVFYVWWFRQAGRRPSPAQLMDKMGTPGRLARPRPTIG
ncbi:MAG: hypothetical protein ACM37V_09505 [Gemmatimonadota bacterium]